MQKSESFTLSSLLSFSGGLQDAYTYNVRGEVFANALVSFSCAMQVQSFRTVHGFGYASTMCIGNMRSAATSLSQYIRTKKKSYLYKSLHFFGIILIFAIGAGIGGLLSMTMGEGTIWFSAITLIIVTLMMIKK